MKTETKYAYQKRIKELETEARNLRQWKYLGLDIYDWLSPFAGDENKKGFTPNAAYGLKMFRQREVFK